MTLYYMCYYECCILLLLFENGVEEANLGVEQEVKVEQQF